MATCSRSNSEDLISHANRLVSNGHKIVLSAWHAYELSKTSNDEQIELCLELIKNIQPVWLSNQTYVKREEIKKFLNEKWEVTNFEIHSNPAFNTLVSQMWSTYGTPFVGETIDEYVHFLKNNQLSRQDLDNTVQDFPNALSVGRSAAEIGIDKLWEIVVDREYFIGLVPLEVRDKATTFLVNNKQEVLASCPTVAIDACLTKTRVRESFIPKGSDAVDFQHALVSLAYCSHFVSDDKMLVEHSTRCIKQTKLSCIVTRDLLGITP